jgi:GMP synthase-like glutamine amidotransferase
VPFEAPEEIAVWAERRGHVLTVTLMYESHSLPLADDFDMLVIMGGPMGVHDEEVIPWLKGEKALISAAISSRKLTLGICLGAQLIAEQIGGEVYKNKWNEIGWFPVKLMEGAKESIFFKVFPEQFVPFHWHGDTFSLPAEAKRMAFSLGCANQGFEYAEHVVGLQFHLEANDISIRRIIDNCGEQIQQQDEYVQARSGMVGQHERVRASNEILFSLLDAMEGKYLFRA